MAKKKPDENELSFEEALLALEEIVEKMESGQFTLEESLKNYEAGIKLSRTCALLLSKAETRVKQLTKDQQGQIIEQPYLIAD